MKTSRPLQSTRGEASLAVLAVLALVGVLAVKAPSGSPGKNHWWEFWKPNPIEQVNKAAEAVDAAKAKAAADAAVEQAKIDAAKAKQLKIAQEAALATGSAIDAAAATTAAGQLPAKELATAKELNRTNTQAMDQAIGAADPVRIRELETMVANLNAGVAAGTRALELMQGTLDRTVADKAAAQAELSRRNAENAAIVATLETKFAGEQKKSQAWALERDAIARDYERLMFWGKVGVLFVALIVLYVLFLLLRTHKLGNFAKDAVGMTEMLKDEIQKRASADDYASIKKKMSDDWMTVHDGSAALVAKFKSQLRL